MKFTEIRSPVSGAKAYLTGSNCSVLVATEPTGPKNELRWHMSIAHRKRLPTWWEVRDARYELIPNEITMVMILPPQEEYVNAHEHCFHLFQLEEGEIARPKIVAP